MIGQTLGSYRIVEQIGMGGMATVYKAYDPSTDRYVAVKVLPDYYSQDPTFKARFEREAKAIARLEHLHILPVHVYGEDNGRAFLAMRLMTTGTLKERIQSRPLPLPEISRLLTQIASALDYAHQRGVIHRDIKPSNVLLDADGNAYLTDFGIAKMIEGGSEVTGSGMVGTPQYMSPEQCQGRKDLSAATDIYSLGALLYEMVVGHTPYQAETPMAIIHMQLTGAPLPPPRSIRPNLPEAVEGIILKALAREPKDRWETCAAMAGAFAECVAGQPAATGPDIMDATFDPDYAAPTREAPLHGDRAGTLPAPSAPAPARRGLPVWAYVLIGGLAIAGALGGVAALIGAGLPPSPTAVPTMYDDFDDPAYDGSFNPGLWTTDSQSLPFVIQQSGALIVRQADRPDYGTSVTAFKYANFTLDTPIAFQADMMVEAQENAGSVHMFVRSDPGQSDSPFEEITCGINTETGSPRAHMNCWDRWNIGKEPQEDSYAVPNSLLVDFGTWHTARIEVDPATMTLTYFLDGQLVGSHTPARAEQLKSRKFLFAIGLYVASAEAVTGFFDNVRIEPLAAAQASLPPTSGPAQAGGAEQARAFATPTAVPLPEWAITAEGRTVNPCREDALCVESTVGQQTMIPLGQSFAWIEGLGWSPDGKQIVFGGCPAAMASSGDACPDLFVVSLESGETRALVADAGEANKLPAWSPDGQWIAFHQSCGVNVIRPDGSDRRALTPSGPTMACAEFIAWSPDSQQLAWIAGPGGGQAEHNSRVFVIGLDRSGAREVIDIVDTGFLSNSRGALAWTPDGSALVAQILSGETLQISLECDQDAAPCDPLALPRLAEFPVQWLPTFTPQWGGAAGPP